MTWIEKSMDDYFSWLKENTFITHDEHSGWEAIHTPFYGIFNDNIEIYVRQENGRVLLSDDGQTLNRLELAGVQISRSPKRKEWLDKILLNHGVRLDEKDELVTQGELKDFAQKKHNLLNAIIEVSEMESLAAHTVASLFKEDVRAFLDEQEIVYTPEFIARGASGIEFTFDFQIAGRQNEIVIKAMNSLNRLNVPSFLFAWDDIRSVREKMTGKNMRGLVFVNDVEQKADANLLEGLHKKTADTIRWSERHKREMLDMLAA